MIKGVRDQQNNWVEEIEDIVGVATEYLVEDLIHSLSNEEQELFWVQCWIIWNQRNSALYGGKLQNPSLPNKQASDYLDEFKGTQAQLAVPANME